MVALHYPSRHSVVLRNWAEAHGSSIEIAQAIMVVVDGDFEVAERLLSSPTETERKKVVELAFEIQYRDFPDPEYQDVCLYWDEGKVYFGG